MNISSIGNVKFLGNDNSAGKSKFDHSDIDVPYFLKNTPPVRSSEPRIVNFSQARNKTGDGKQRNITKNSDGDSFEAKSKQPKKGSNGTKPPRLTKQGLGACLAAAFMMGYGAHVAVESIPNGKPSDSYVYTGDKTVVETADEFGIDVNALLGANKINNSDAVLGSLIIPGEYHIYDDAIKNYEQKEDKQLDKGNEEKSKNYRYKKEYLEDKQAKMETEFSFYAFPDSKYVLIVPKEGVRVYADTLREACNLKEGAISGCSLNSYLLDSIPCTGKEGDHQRAWNDLLIPKEGIYVTKGDFVIPE